MDNEGAHHRSYPLTSPQRHDPSPDPPMDVPKPSSKNSKSLERSNCNAGSNLRQRSCQSVGRANKCTNEDVDDVSSDEESDDTPELRRFSSNLSRSMVNLGKSASKFLWQLQLHADLPFWRRDNDFLVGSHRPCVYSFSECFKSVFKFHSETLNIWTHLLGFIFVVIYVCVRSKDDLSSYEEGILRLHEFCAAMCLLFSTAFHVFECHSPNVHEFFCRLDHFGIALLIWGSKLALIQCTSVDRALLINNNLQIGATVVAFFSITLQFSGFFARAENRTVRTVWFFASSTVFVFLPTLDVWWRKGLDVTYRVCQLHYFFLSIFSITIGSFCYVARIPERFDPGTFDIFLQGHQILHIFVNFTILFQLMGFRRSAVARAALKSARLYQG